MRRAFLPVVVVAALVSLLLSGCSSDRIDQPGINSAEDALQHLVDAAMSDDVESASLVIWDMSEAGIKENLAQIRSYVESAGGISKVSIVENTNERMGAEHIVELRIADTSQVARFSVIEDSSGISVVPNDPDPIEDDEPSSNPNPVPEPSGTQMPGAVSSSLTRI